MRGHGFIALIAIFLAFLPSAFAQTANGEQIREDLVAQFQASLIRERRIADERELRILADAEHRIAQARAASDRTSARARSELAIARAEYAQLAQQIIARDEASRITAEAYREQIDNALRQASPEELAAFARFAAGDQNGAWPVLERIRRERASARQRVADHVNHRARELDGQDAIRAAQMRAAMRRNGNASARDVFELWREAAILLPRDFDVQYSLAYAAASVGEIDISHRATTEAIRSARTPPERWLAHSAAADIAIRRGAYGEAIGFYETMLSNPQTELPLMVPLMLFVTERELGYAHFLNGDPETARHHLTSALARSRTIGGMQQWGVAYLAQLHIRLGETSRALAHRAERVADIERAYTHLSEAAAAFDQAITYARQSGQRLTLSAALINRAVVRACLPVAPPDLGICVIDQNDERLFAEGIAILETLIREDSNAIDYRVNYAVAMNHAAYLGLQNKMPADEAEAWRAVARLRPLLPAEQELLANATDASLP